MRIRIYLLSFIAALILLSPSDIFAVSPTKESIEPTNMAKPTQTVMITPQLDELDEIKSEVKKLKDDNYTLLMNFSKTTVERADRIITWMTGFATIFGFLLAILSIVVGGDLARKLKTLGQHVERAKKNTLLLETMSKEAQEKGKELVKYISQIKEAEKEISQTKGKASEEAKNIKELVNKAEEAISELKVLKNSADFISAATVSPYSAGTLSGVSGGTMSAVETLSSANKCSRCGKTMSLFENYYDFSDPSATTTFGPKLCKECKKLTIDQQS